jgi:hypothetical protein
MPTASRIFGAGRPFALPNITNPTPIRFGVPQDMSLDFKRTTKPLFGENMFPEDVAGGEMTVTGKVTMGELSGDLFANLFQATLAAGTTMEADNEQGVVAAATPYKITVANSATWTVDLGVKNVNGNYLSRVAAGSEVAGNSYSVAAGAYQFAAKDAGLTYYISYLYTSATAGHTLTLANSVQGPTDSFTAVMAYLNGTNQNIVTLNNCITSDTAMASKQGDWGKPTYGYDAAVDDNGVLGTMAFAV